MDDINNKEIDEMNESDKLFLYNFIKKRLEQDKKKKLPTYKCSICGKLFQGYGNNAQPINNGRCCNECNLQVVRERIRQWEEQKQKEDDVNGKSTN